LRAAGEPFADKLAAILPSLPAAWPRVAALAAWLRSVSEVEPPLLVRNPRLLNWSDTPAKWAERLASITGTAIDQLQSLAAFVELTDNELIGESGEPTSALADIVERVRVWKISIERYNEWPPVRDHLKRLSLAIDDSLFQRIYDGRIPPAELPERVSLAIYEQIWNHMCRSDTELARIDGRLLDQVVGSFRSLDQARVSAAAAEVKRRHADNRPRGTVGEMAIVHQEINKVRKFLPLRRLLDQAGNAIRRLKPVFLMSPLSVAQYLAPGRHNFDLLLIDEASQVRPEDALGAVARASQIVVVGDMKQLPPTNFFNRMVEDSDDDPEIDATGAQIGAMESILSLCDATLGNRTMLKWHYRSHHPALIRVSNRSFYDDKLLLPPSVTLGTSGDGLGVVFHKTPPGGYDRGRTATNVTEADIVADAVCAFATNYPNKSLGVGTFSVAQRDVIRDRIDARRRAAPKLEAFFSASRANPFFVKNLESIQGDERDVIFISIGYGRDADGRLVQSFGPLNAEGGERRLNVLISRARERCEVFSPISDEDIDLSSRKPGVVALRDFLRFAEKGYMDAPERSGRAFDSDFEESVANFLIGRGYAVHGQVGMAGFYIDLGVLSDKNATRYLLGVECDGATYHSSRSARDRDRIRQAILESRGWRIHRIWSSDWFNRRSAEEHRLLDALHRTQAAPPPEPLQPPTIPTLEHASALPAKEFGAQVQRVTIPYTEATFRVNSSAMPHEAQQQAVDAVRRIIEIEAPIHEDEVGRRLATVWGLERAGSRIQETASRALQLLARRREVQSNGLFWRAMNSGPVVARDRSNTQSSTLRRADHLPPAEIAVTAEGIVRESIAVPMDQLVVEVARRLGFQRTGPELQAAILASIRAALGETFLQEADGTVMLVKRTPATG
jgi:very-short-patch-repair endonuclease